MTGPYAGLRQAAVNAQQQLGNLYVQAAYTAAAQPAVVLRLLDELERLHAAVAEEDNQQPRRIGDVLLVSYGPTREPPTDEAMTVHLTDVPGHPDGGSTT